MVSTGRAEGAERPVSVAELLAQDALFQAVAGVEQHAHRDGLVGQHLDAADVAHLVVVGDRGDGALVSTPAGSTAYNLSAHGPILPIDAALLALTPISAFRPRRWRGALLSHTARLRLEVLEGAKRPVSAVADDLEVRDVKAVDVAEDRAVAMTMLYDAGHNLDERILSEQFY